jgi:hypothetical protein
MKAGDAGPDRCCDVPSGVVDGLPCSELDQAGRVANRGGCHNGRTPSRCKLDYIPADAPGRSDDQNRFARLRVDRVDSNERSDARQRKCSRRHETEHCRLARNEAIFRDDDVVGPGSTAGVEPLPGNEPEHVVSFGEERRLAADAVYDAGKVVPEHNGELMLHRREQAARCHHPVDVLDRRRPNVYQYLVGLRFWHGQLAKAPPAYGVVKDDRTHAHFLHRRPVAHTVEGQLPVDR